MVDVSGKRPTRRTARARALVLLGSRAFHALDRAENRKGDALAVARIAGIQAAKRTAEWIPLCHPLAFDSVAVTCRPLARTKSVEVVAEVRGTGRTGYEMEALVAASASALALYDMCKGADKGIVIGPVELLSKTGGKSGAWTNPTLRRSFAPGRGPRSGGGLPTEGGGRWSSRRRA